MTSYKGVVDNRRKKDQDGENMAQYDKNKGKRLDIDDRGNPEGQKHQRDYRSYRNRKGMRYRGEGSQINPNQRPQSRYEQRHSSSKIANVK